MNEVQQYNGDTTDVSISGAYYTSKSVFKVPVLEVISLKNGIVVLSFIVNDIMTEISNSN